MNELQKIIHKVGFLTIHPLEMHFSDDFPIICNFTNVVGAVIYWICDVCQQHFA
jgi:hypothetical protein